jgi:hypothetical protein
MTGTRIAPDDYRNPKWDEAVMVHEWKNYAGAWLREIWPTLNAEQQRAVAASLDDVASNEEWD